MTGSYVDEFLPHPPENAWHALTDPSLMARWLMPNDFRLELSHRFTFHTDPIPAAGFGGTGHAEVPGFDEGKMLKLAWRAAPEPPGLHGHVPAGTRGHRHPPVHRARRFRPQRSLQAASRRILGTGWPGMPGRIAAVIDEHT